MRSVPEWKGKTDDAAIPPRVKLRIWERDQGKCQCCFRVLRPGDKFHYDHIVALVNQGAHSEANLQLLCFGCHLQKTEMDLKAKATTARLLKKRIGAHESRHIVPGSKRSNMKKCVDGTVIDRRTGRVWGEQ